MQRPDKERWFLNIAEQIALRSTCLRRNFGAVIIKEDEIIATGYGGAPRETINCDSVGFCYRDRVGARKGEHYELCRAVHAEQNAIIQARRLDMIGATLYLVGLDAKTKDRLIDAEPCRICRRTIINAGIERVVVGLTDDKIRDYFITDWVENSLWEFRKSNGRLIPVLPPLSLSDPNDEERRVRLISQFSLADAVVTQTTSFENCKQTVGRAAARYFDSNVKNGDSVALSCGDTIHSLLEFLPYHSDRKLAIHQLSIEGDPYMIHQAPSTLVGLLRGKSSSKSQVYGLQLPPLELSPLSTQIREDLAGSTILAKLRKKALNSDFVFFGVGSSDRNSVSFWPMAQAATNHKFLYYIKKMKIVGEINNQVFDETGTDCTHGVPGLSKYLINILSLNEIRKMASKYPKHKVVMVASGPEKTQAIRAALQKGYANVIITGRDDADRLLCN
jgi:dCMP deaminase